MADDKELGFRTEEAERRDSHGLPSPSDTSAKSQSPVPTTLDDERSDAATTEARLGLTRTTSTRRELVKVPRTSRRGLLSQFTLIPEVTEPTDYSNSTKWTITFTVSIAGAAGPLGSAILFPGLHAITHEFHTDATTANLNVAFYMLAMSIFPLWWSSFSETLGRRTIYVVSFTLFVIFGALCAVAQDIAMLIVMRMLSGGAAASVQAVGAGTISDIWEPRERGRAMGMFYLGPLCGPMLAPIIGGALTQGFGWRSSMWFLVIYGGILVVFLVLCLPETLKKRKDAVAAATRQAEKDVVGDKETAVTKLDKARGSEEEHGTTRPTLERVTTTQSVKIKTRKWLLLLKRSFIDPLKIILLLRYPAVFVTVLYASITFGTLYFLNVSIETTFARSPYNFSTLVVGLTYIPGSSGYVVSSILGGRWLDHIMKREAKRAGRYNPDGSGRLVFRPEDRMRENAWLGCFMFPAALIWYGWAVEYHVHWIVPLIANFFFGCGSMIVFAMATTMLTEFLPARASMGIAVNNFLRNIFSCIGAIIAAPLIDSIGNGWMCTMLALISLACGIPIIWAMKKHGARWRDSLEEQMKSW